MQFMLDTNSLISALSAVMRAVPSKAVIPAMEGVLFEVNDGQLTLTGTDGKITIQTSLDASVTEEGKALLPGKLLNDLARRLPGLETSFTMDGGKVKIQSATSRSNLTSMDADTFPKRNPQKGEPVTVPFPGDKLKAMIEKTAYAVATDDTRPILTGVLFETDPEQGLARMVALDGFRMSVQECELPAVANCGALKHIIPARALAEIRRMISGDGDETLLTFSSGEVEVRVHDTTLTATLMSGQYMDWQKILPTVYATETLVKREALQAAIDRTAIVAREGKNNLIKLTIDKDEMTVSSRAEIAQVEDSLPATTVGKGLEIAFNAKYLIDILKGCTADEVTMQFNTPVAPVVVLPWEQKHEIYLVMPVRTM